MTEHNLCLILMTATAENVSILLHTLEYKYRLGTIVWLFVKDISSEAQ